MIESREKKKKVQREKKKNPNLRGKKKGAGRLKVEGGTYKRKKKNMTYCR